MLFYNHIYSVIICLLHHCEIYKSSINHSIYLHHAKTHGFINAFSSLCDARYIWSPASLSIQYSPHKITLYISITRKRADLSMHFHLTVMQGIFDMLHHFADLYCLQIPSIYLHLLNTYGFINSFSSHRYVRYTWSPASLCRSILSAKSLNISPSCKNTRIYQFISISPLCKIYSASRIICSSPSIM